MLADTMSGIMANHRMIEAASSKTIMGVKDESERLRTVLSQKYAELVKDKSTMGLRARRKQSNLNWGTTSSIEWGFAWWLAC